jgi:phytoene/squalene synthetase
LQVINHLQDCGADYRRLNRVYIPLDTLAAKGASIESLAASKASPELLACIHELAAKTGTLLGQAEFSRHIKDLRLSLEVAAIERLAKKLVQMLMRRDPLSERVHLGKSGFAAILIAAVCLGLGQRLFSTRAGSSAVLEGIDDQPSR